MKEKASTALWGFRSLGLQMHGVKRWNLNPQVQVRSLEKTRKTWIFQALGNYVRVRSHTQKRQKYLFYSPYTEKPTSLDLSVFQLSAPFGAWSLLRKWSCPADSEVSAEVSGALNFILCARIILHYAVRHNFTSALADTSLKTARVRIHTQKRQKYLFCSP